MSGVEIVGIVLGTWPVVINLAKTVKAAKDGVTISDLELQFKTDLYLMRELVSHMLESIDDLSEEERIILSDTTKESRDYWNRPNLAVKLQDRLGNALPLIVDQMKAIHRVLSQIQSKLSSGEGSLVGRPLYIIHWTSMPLTQNSIPQQQNATF